MPYNPDDYLLLSGIQHFAFCRRQWALIHVENQWQENYHTMDGMLMHKNAHDPFFSEKRGDVIIKRSVSVSSRELGISGECDVVEYHAAPEGISLAGYPGTWLPFPIEYKRGKPGTTDGNALQLCAQAMCLEEMLCCQIPSGALYYGETRHREPVDFSPELRAQVKIYVKEMHEVFARGATPRVKPHKGCRTCSLQDLCLPKLMKRKSVSIYVEEALKEE